MWCHWILSSLLVSYDVTNPIYRHMSCSEYAAWAARIYEADAATERLARESIAFHKSGYRILPPTTATTVTTFLASTVHDTPRGGRSGTSQPLAFSSPKRPRGYTAMARGEAVEENVVEEISVRPQLQLLYILYYTYVYIRILMLPLFYFYILGEENDWVYIYIYIYIYIIYIYVCIYI